MEVKLYEEICFIRKQGLRVTQRFLCSRGRQLGGGDVRASHSRFHNFLHRPGMTMRNPLNVAANAESNRPKIAQQ